MAQMESIGIKRRKEIQRKCVIELDSGVITRHVTGQLVTEIIKYFLYDRQQIPFPLTNSKSINQLKQRSLDNQLTTRETLIMTMIDNLTDLMNEVICLMNLDDIIIDLVALSLGQTLQMPKEFYCIEIPAQDIYLVKHSSDCRQITERSAITRFFKTILNDNVFQNQKTIAITKMFVLIKVNKCYVKQVMDHSVNCHQSDQLFTPFIDYRIPKFGNKYSLAVTQKSCNCFPIANTGWKIFDDSLNKSGLNETMTELSIHDSNSESIDDKPIDKSNEDFVWIQIRSSIKGCNYNIKH